MKFSEAVRIPKNVKSKRSRINFTPLQFSSFQLTFLLQIFHFTERVSDGTHLSCGLVWFGVKGSRRAAGKNSRRTETPKLLRLANRLPAAGRRRLPRPNTPLSSLSNRVQRLLCRSRISEDIRAETKTSGARHSSGMLSEKPQSSNYNGSSYYVARRKDNVVDAESDEMEPVEKVT